MALTVSAVVIGQYAFALSWSSVMRVSSDLLSVRLARSAATAAHADAGQVTVLFDQVRLVALAVFLRVGAAALAAPIAAPLLLGSAFAPALLPGVLLSVASAILTLTLVAHESALGLGHLGVGIPAEFAATRVGLVLLLLLLRPLGGTGAAIASIASYGTALVVLAIRLDGRLAGRLLPAMRPGAKDVAALASLARTALRPRRIDRAIT